MTFRPRDLDIEFAFNMRNICYYKTADTPRDVESPGYFNAASVDLARGDVIEIDAAVTEDGWTSARFRVVACSPGNVVIRRHGEWETFAERRPEPVMSRDEVVEQLTELLRTEFAEAQRRPSLNMVRRVTSLPVSQEDVEQAWSEVRTARDEDALAGSV